MTKNWKSIESGRLFKIKHIYIIFLTEKSVSVALILYAFSLYKN